MLASRKLVLAIFFTLCAIFSYTFLAKGVVFAVEIEGEVASTADEGCTVTHPNCYLERPAGFSSDACHPASCFQPSQPGDLIRFDGNTCCGQKEEPKDQDVCGTVGKDQKGITSCITPTGYVYDNITSSYTNCSQNTTDTEEGIAKCCSNTGGGGSARCERIRKDMKKENFNLCAQISDAEAKNRCESCAGVNADGEAKGIWTAIGCVNTTKEGLASSAIKLGLGIGGGVVLLMILAASFKLTTSKGDPKATEEAKEMVTNAIGGLLFIIFSVVLIRTIGKDFLQIPGF